MDDIDSLANKVFISIKTYCDGEIARRLQQQDARFIELLAAVPQARDGKDGAPGKDGIDGRNGLDADMQLIREELKTAIAELPKPEDGKDGVDGKDGIDGKSVEVDDVTSIISAVVAELPIPKDGKDGISPAVDYERIIKDVIAMIPEPVKGEDGRDGLPGKDGQDGRPGQDGNDGPPGLDAFELEIMPEIDEARSYPRGTYALHRGGLWISRATKPGVESWDCVIEGVASLAFDETDNIRTLALSVETSAGKRITLEKRIPMLIFKGVWKAGEYDLGDIVQRDGSMWHAKKVTVAEPGILDAAKDWQLLVKRGQDGKNADDSNARRAPDIVRIK